MNKSQALLLLIYTSEVNDFNDKYKEKSYRGEI